MLINKNLEILLVIFKKKLFKFKIKYTRLKILKLDLKAVIIVILMLLVVNHFRRELKKFKEMSSMAKKLMENFKDRLIRFIKNYKLLVINKMIINKNINKKRKKIKKTMNNFKNKRKMSIKY
jgi:hypothetical protein